jgi:DNA primase
MTKPASNWREKGDDRMSQTKAVWIDFKALREKLDFTEVLKHYGVELKLKHGGQRHQGFCPLPGHKGQGRSPSFSCDLKRGIWRCFGCGAGGDIIRFAAFMQSLDPDNGQDVRKAALALSEDLGLPRSEKPAGQKPKGDAPNGHKQNGSKLNGKPKRSIPMLEDRIRSEDSDDAHKNAEQVAACPAIVNAPLDFQLQVDLNHPYLKERGFTVETIAYFGLGYCSRGSMQGRIAIPLHDEHGRLVGYAGRVVDDGQINTENPRYKSPGPHEREGKRYEFHKGLLVYHLFQIPAKVSELTIVEGFSSVWHLHQNGYINTVALMGSDCSDAQAKLILQKVELDGQIALMPDGDDAGRRCANILLEKLSPYRYVRWLKLDQGKQPTDCTPEQLQAMLSV